MPALSFFVDDHGVQALLEHLNTDREIAFIVADGPLTPQQVYLERLKATIGTTSEAGTFFLLDTGYRQTWKAVPSVDRLEDGDHSLWHIPTGPLPLLGLDEPDKEVPNPWEGWTEQRSGADPMAPFFGPRCQAEIRLELWTRYRPYSEAEKSSLPVLISFWDGGHDTLVASAFQWVGGRSAPAPRQTRNWWNRLRAWLDRSATRLVDGSEVFWAFPSALEKLKRGMKYEARGWQLDDAIRRA